MFTAEQMQMEVINRLAALLAIVNNDAVAFVGIRQSLFLCHLVRNPHQVAHLCLLLVRLQILEHAEPIFVFRNHDDMSGGLRCDISERHGVFIFVHYISWDFLADNHVKNRGLSSITRLLRFLSFV